MKTVFTWFGVLTLSALNICAADGKPRKDGNQTDGPGGRKPPETPVIKVLDTNGDGVIDAGEIATASASLKKLDKNGDGKLTRDEIRPKPPKGEGKGGPDGKRKAPAD